MTSRRPVVLVKLGGSLITDKAGRSSARARVIRRLAGELVAGARAGGVRVVLGHGSGSFGHPAAKAGGLDGGLKRRDQLAAVSATQARARELDMLVVDLLRACGAAPFALAPSSFVMSDRGRVLPATLGPLVEALERGLLPVVYGDVVMDRERGVSIVPTERVLLAVADGLRRRGIVLSGALWMGVTPGVYDDRGRPIPLITPRTWRSVKRHVGGAVAIDVTGGMLLRVETALELARRRVPSWILDGRRAGALAGALAGRPIRGTRVACA